jgi:ATP synthase F0 subunit b
LVVILILYFFVFKKIFEKLEERKKIITDGIEKSELAGEKLIEAEKKSGEIISEARIEASEKINLAINTAKEKEEIILSEAKNKGEVILEKAKKTGEDQKKDIISEADEEIVKMAILGAEKILSKK